VQPSIVQTLSVPSVGAGGNPSRLIQAAKTPLRVLVRNTGGTVIFIAHDVSDLSNINAVGAAYQLPAGQSDVFVVAPGQSIIAAAQGAGGQVSIAVSEAIPVGKAYMES